MKKERFSSQYDTLGLQAAASNMDRGEKAHSIYQAACKILGLHPANLPATVGDDFHPSVVAFYKLQVIRKAIVGNWVPDWNKRTYKWYPWFYMDSPGFRFHGSRYGYSHTRAAGGSRLCCETEEQADFLGVECVALWADFFGAELAPVEVVEAEDED
jgi:hypothetical protein